MKNKKNKKQLKTVLCTVAFFALFFLLGVALAEYSENLPQSSLPDFVKYIILLILFFASFIIQIIIHEAGHLVFGLISGYKFSSFRIFGLMLVKEDGKFKFKNLSIDGTSGQCLMTPPDNALNNIENTPVVLYNLGGVIFNYASAVLFTLLILTTKIYTYQFAIFALLSLTGLYCGIINSIPSFSSISNDGYNTVSVCRSTAAKRAMIIQLSINERYSKNVFLKDMPDEWFEMPADDEMTDSLLSSIAMFACNRLMEQHKFDEAVSCMNHVLEIDSDTPEVYVRLLTCDLIYCELISENRKEILDGLMDKETKKFMNAMKSNLSVMRVEYTYALLSEHDREKADKIKAKFDKAANKHPYKCDIESERSLIEIADSKATMAE